MCCWCQRRSVLSGRQRPLENKYDETTTLPYSNSAKCISQYFYLELYFFQRVTFFVFSKYLLWSLFSLGHSGSSTWPVLCKMTMSRLLIGCVLALLTVAELFCHYLYAIVFVWVSLHFEMLQSFTGSFGSRYSQGMPLVQLHVRRHEDRVIWRYRPFGGRLFLESRNKLCRPHGDCCLCFRGIQDQWCSTERLFPALRVWGRLSQLWDFQNCNSDQVLQLRSLQHSPCPW